MMPSRIQPQEINLDSQSHDHSLGGSGGHRMQTAIIMVG